MALTKKQKEVFDYILSYTHTQGVAPTQKEIKDHFGLKSFGSVQRYLKYLIEAGYIEQDWNAKRGLKIKKEESSKDHSSITLPLLGQAAAGNPIEAIENSTETIDIPASLVRSTHKHFALDIYGDSMIEEGILEGDVIICRQQNVADNGQIVVALVDGEATVKRFYHYSDRIELHPANARLKPFIYSQQEAQALRLAGVVVGLFRRYE